MQIMKNLNILLITDRKPGHEQQSLGLIKALSRTLSISIITIPPLSKTKILLKLFAKKQSDFQIVIGTGHKTHLSVLFFAWYYKAIKIILMKPSLPYFLFDACIVPSHDNPPQNKNIISTLGPLNQLVGPFNKQQQTLILLGGTSKHYEWDNAHILKQLENICQKIKPQEPIFLSTSRRTPATFLTLLEQSSFSQRIHIFDHEVTHKNWLINMLKISQDVYVTPDSVSMIYESLTANCTVYLFDLKPNNDKITHAIDQLKQQQWVFGYDQTNIIKDTDRQPLNEAQRVAEWIIKNFNLDIYQKNISNK